MLSTIHQRRYQLGVNLIEVMVAMAIGLFLVLGATTLYVSTKKTSDVDDSIARLQETARYALSIIETDVRMANYQGATNNGDMIENLDKNLFTPPAEKSGALETGGSQDCGAGYAVAMDFYVEADNNNYGFACAAKGAAVSSADTLTVRRVSTTNSGPNPARLQICANRSWAYLTKGTPTDPANCPPNTEYHHTIVNGYYVDQRSDQSTTYPSLRRKTLGVDSAGTGPGFSDVEIIPGVEDMQIELGWDNSSELDNPANAVRYVQPENALLVNAAGDGPNGRIVSVRVWMLIRAEQPDFTFRDTRTYEYGDRAIANGTTANLSAGGADTQAYAPNDNFRRLLVSRTFFIRNVTGR